MSEDKTPDPDMQKAREIVCSCTNVSTWGHDPMCDQAASYVLTAIKAEREACAALCDDRAAAIKAAIDSIGKMLDAPEFKKTATAELQQLGLTATAIRARGGE